MLCFRAGGHADTRLCDLEQMLGVCAAGLLDWDRAGT
jgi:hypothetical protein